jgi:hypothetical protein
MLLCVVKRSASHNSCCLDQLASHARSFCNIRIAEVRHKYCARVYMCVGGEGGSFVIKPHHPPDRGTKLVPLCPQHTYKQCWLYTPPASDWTCINIHGRRVRSLAAIMRLCTHTHTHVQRTGANHSRHCDHIISYTEVAQTVTHRTCHHQIVVYVKSHSSLLRAFSYMS